MSFERIHRSNLIGMGVLPLQFRDGENVKSLGLTGHETFDILKLDEGLEPGAILEVQAKKDNGEVIKFDVITRIDTPIEIEYFRNGGILHTVIRQLLAESQE
jgi:aconitate hydratase